jgi:hypothetical protein
MATPYSVPSINDIIYSRSRVPSMEQITFNNLLTAIQKVQDAGETKKEREFVLERDRLANEAAADRDRRQTEVQKARDLASDKWRRGQAKESSRRRTEDLHRADMNESFNVLESLLDDGNLPASKSAINKIRSKPGYNEESWGDRLTLYEEDLAYKQVEQAKVDGARKTLRDFFNNQLPWEDVLTSDFMLNATEAQFERLLSKRNLNEKERTGIQDAVFDSDLKLLDGEIMYWAKERQEQWALADEEGKQELDANLEEALLAKTAREEEEYLKRGLMKPKEKDDKRTPEEVMAGLKTFDLRTALTTFWSVAKPGGQQFLDPAALDAVESDVFSGLFIPIVSPEGHYVWFKSREQALKDGDITEDYRYDINDGSTDWQPTGIIDSKKDKLLQDTKHLSGMGELLESLEQEMVSEDMVADRARGYGANQRMSNAEDENPASPIWAAKPGHVPPDSPDYVPKSMRELFGYVRQVDAQLNKYRKMAIRNKKDKKVVAAAEGVKQWAITQLTHLRESTSQPGIYDKQTGNLIIKLVNTIDSTLEQLQGNSWMYKSYRFRPRGRASQEIFGKERKGGFTRQVKPMGIPPQKPRMLR